MIPLLKQSINGGHISREKALDFAKELHITGFKTSEGWLDWWKNIHN